MCNYPQWILFFFRFNPSNLCREATQATLTIIKALKVNIFDVIILHMAILGTLGFIFWEFFENQKTFIAKNLEFKKNP